MEGKLLTWRTSHVRLQVQPSCCQSPITVLHTVFSLHLLTWSSTDTTWPQSFSFVTSDVTKGFGSGELQELLYRLYFCAISRSVFNFTVHPWTLDTRMHVSPTLARWAPLPFPRLNTAKSRWALGPNFTPLWSLTKVQLQGSEMWWLVDNNAAPNSTPLLVPLRRVRCSSLGAEIW